ncbi:MAG: hypothetical protein IT239_03815 [Bacteroidia bacterium]|nr:hypothetical protein [Bacteroidia bacterium]
MPDRTDTQYLEEIANTLKGIKLVIQDLKSTIEAQHEILIDRLGNIELFTSDTRDFLEKIEAKQ